MDINKRKVNIFAANIFSKSKGYMLIVVVWYYCITQNQMSLIYSHFNFKFKKINLSEFDFAN